MKMNLKLSVLSGEHTVHRFSPEQDIPSSVLKSELFSITRTEDELSVICDARISVSSEKSESGWACIKVLGPLDFGLTGILARLSGVLAEAEISIFAISTYDTDYVLVKEKTLSKAKQVLRAAGYSL